jgi:hypothetical protein
VILTKWNSALQPLQSHIKHSATKARGSIKPASSSSLGINHLKLLHETRSPLEACGDDVVRNKHQLLGFIFRESCSAATKNI